MKILIITELVAPVQAVAAIRWTKLGKYLAKEHDCSVTVLTNEKGYDGQDLTVKQYKYDETLLNDSKWYQEIDIPLRTTQRLFNLIINKLVFLHVNIAKYEPRSSFHVCAVRVLRGILNFLLGVFDWLGGFFLAKSAASCCLSSNSYFDVVISSYGPRWPHQAARMIKKSYPDIIWLADFRDPAVRSEQTNTFFHRKYADSVTRHANCVIGVSRGTVDNLFLSSERKAVVLPNGFDASEKSSEARKNTDRFIFAYTGTLYVGYQDLSPLFRAIEELILEIESFKNDVVVLYAGPTSSQFNKWCNDYPSVPTFDCGLVERNKAIEIQNEASALIVSAWNLPIQRGVLTGKIFEYMRSDAPVIGFCSGSVPNSDLREIIESSHLGICYEETDEAGIERVKSYILELYSQWKDKGYTSRLPDSAALVNRYSYSSLSGDLYQLIKKLKEERTEPI